MPEELSSVERRLRQPRQLPVPVRVLAALALAMMAACTGTLLEALGGGPYTTWFNHHRRDIVVGAGLIGGPESGAVALLGRPDKVKDFPAPRIMHADGTVTVVGRPYRRFTYSPYPWLPFAQFRLYSEEGVVTSYKLFAE